MRSDTATQEGVTVYDLDGDFWRGMNPLNGMGLTVRGLGKTWGWRFFKFWPYSIPRVDRELASQKAARTTERRVYYDEQVGCCPYCGRKMLLLGPPLKLAHHPRVGTYDHITPLSRGGADTQRNTVLACGYCNNRKGSKALIVFLAEIRPPHTDWLPSHQTAAD